MPQGHARGNQPLRWCTGPMLLFHRLVAPPRPSEPVIRRTVRTGLLIGGCCLLYWPSGMHTAGDSSLSESSDCDKRPRMKNASTFAEVRQFLSYYFHRLISYNFNITQETSGIFVICCLSYIYMHTVATIKI